MTADTVPMVRAAPLPSAAASEAAALIGMLERIVGDPNVDIDRVERIYAMYEKASARSAKSAYLTALAAMQPTLPVIGKAGVIERGKDKNGDARKPSPYARYEDVVEGINPCLREHGFSLSFRISQADPGRVLVTGILGHRDGHTEETSLSLPIDDSGGKNAVQGWGSSVSYGKRYTAFALLNIVARGEDDDGMSRSATETITEEQAEEIKAALDATGGQLPRFAAYWKIDRLTDLPVEKFRAAMDSITTAARRRSANG